VIARTASFPYQHRYRASEAKNVIYINAVMNGSECFKTNRAIAIESKCDAETEIRPRFERPKIYVCWKPKGIPGSRREEGDSESTS
jgi:hypothetical protein